MNSRASNAKLNHTFNHHDFHPTITRYALAASAWPPTECWVSTRHVVSVYYAGQATFVEIDNGRTAQFDYTEDEEARTAADLFQRAMSHAPTEEERKAYPKPIDGTIVSRR